MKSMSTCPKCRSKSIMRDVRILDHDEGYESELAVGIYEDPDAPFQAERRGHYGSLRTNVCGKCGHAELFVQGHEALWEVYRKTLAS